MRGGNCSGEFIFCICLNTPDMRLADLIVTKLQKKVDETRALFAAAEHMDQQSVKVVCYILDQSQVRLWEILQQAEMEARRFNACVTETYLQGQIVTDTCLKEMAHSLRCVQIDLVPLTSTTGKNFC